MRQNARISVVMCTYNGEDFLEEQLRSIAAQTVEPLELVIFDDGSTDQTLTLLRQFAESATFSVRIMRNEERLGSTRNFQQAIEAAHGELLALCDQDDIWKTTKLETLARLFEDHSICGVFSDALLIDESGRELAGSLWSRGHLGREQQRAYREDAVGLLLRQDVATGATMMFRCEVRDPYTEIPREWVHDGWLTWMMTLYAERVGRLEMLTKQETIYRIHERQQTGRAAAQAGSGAEPAMTRLRKARASGHEHHRAAAIRLRLVLDHWMLHGAEKVGAGGVAARLRGAIALLEARASLPAQPLPRLVRVITLLPQYLRYGHGMRSALRDILA